MERSFLGYGTLYTDHAAHQELPFVTKLNDGANTGQGERSVKIQLEFVLAHDFPRRSEVIEQINNMKTADITRDVTPYYWILEFRPDRINPGYGPMHPYIAIEVLHGDGTAPTEFRLYERNGFVFKLEIYNADHSPMDLNTIMDGEIFVRSGA